MSKVKKSLTGGNKIEAKPKRTKQGGGLHSKPNHGRKKLRGQGKG
jgi:hypothetical protein